MQGSLHLQCWVEVQQRGGDVPTFSKLLTEAYKDKSKQWSGNGEIKETATPKASNETNNSSIDMQAKSPNIHCLYSQKFMLSEQFNLSLQIKIK